MAEHEYVWRIVWREREVGQTGRGTVHTRDFADKAEAQDRARVLKGKPNVTEGPSEPRRVRKS